MSGEISSLDHQLEVKKTPNTKVDINDLLSRVRDEKKKERKENLFKFLFVECMQWIL